MMIVEQIFRTQIWLGQKIPHSWRIALTQSPFAYWLRRASLISKDGSVVVSLNGALESYRMRLDMRAGHRRYALGSYEAEVVEVIHTIQRGETVMDIGANIGYFTLLMAHQVGTGGQVIAFEPVPSVYARLCENLELNDLRHVKAECMAVADSQGEGQMQFDENTLMPFTAGLAKGGNLAVQTISVDSYVETNGLSRLDFVKIDVEGAEDTVIRGMMKTLQTFRPVVLIEIHANDGRESEGLMQLKEMGYQLQRVQIGGLSPTDTRAQGGSILARGST